MAINSNSWSMTKEERAAQNAKLKLHGYHWMRNDKAKWALIDAQNGNAEVQLGIALAAIESGRRAKVGPEYNYMDRYAAIRWAQALTQRPQTGRRVIVLDTEASGLRDKDVVIEISAVDLAGNVVIDTFVYPEIVIEEEASQVHGITMDMLQMAKAPLFTDIWPQLQVLLSSCELVVYNSAYDVRLLRQTAARYNLEMPSVVSHCLMKQYAAFYGEIRPAAKPDVQYLPKKLEQACEHLSIPAGGHRALADAEAARQVLLAMADSEV